MSLDDHKLNEPMIIEEDKDDGVVDIVDKFTPTIFIRGVFDDKMVAGFRKAVNTIKYERGVRAAIIDISSPGGSVLSLFEILGIMSQSGLRYITYCSGQAASCGAVLLGVGEQRWISPYGSVMIHGVSNFLGYAPVEEHLIEQDHVKKINDKIMSLLAKSCKMNVKTLSKRIKDTGGRTLWLMAEESVDFGICDVIGHPVLSKEEQYLISNSITEKK